MTTEVKSFTKRREMRREMGPGANESKDPSPGLTGRACDQCHARKVKCDGQSPCVRCRRGKVVCSFKNPVRPKGPPPRKAKTRKQAREKASPYHTLSQTIEPLAQPLTKPFPQILAQDLPENLTSSQPTSTFSYAAHSVPSPIQPLTSITQLETPDISIADSEDPLSLENLLQIDWSSFAPPNPIDSLEPECTLGVQNSQPALGIRESQDVSVNITRPETQALVLSRPTSRLGSRRNSFSTYDLPSFFPQPSFPFPSLPTFTESSLFPLPVQSTSTPSPLFVLTLETLILPALSAFFSSIYPMIPVIPPSYIYPRLYTGISHSFVSLVLSMAALALVHPREPDSSLHAIKYRQATALLEEATRLRGWSFGSAPTVEDVLASYLMFGALFELGHAGGARMRLVESVVLGQNMRLGDTSSYEGLDDDEIGRRIRMYWVLAVTERAYALQRSGTIVFGGPISIPRLATDSTQSSLSLLARVFSYIDQDVLVCWSGCTPATCKLTAKRADHILSSLSGSAADVFGDEAELASLTESQKADLLVTWQWLRNRLWRIAAAHGFVGNKGVDYVVDVANTTLAICKRLSSAAMDSHGTGFVEKLYDIASIATDMLGGVEGGNSLVKTRSTEIEPIRQSLVHVARGGEWARMMREMYGYVTRHRAGHACEDKFAQSMALASNIDSA